MEHTGYQPLAPGCKVPFEVVQARRFELVDANGVPLGGIGWSDEGNLGFSLTTQDGRMRTQIQLVIDAKGCGLALADEAGRPRLELRVTGKGDCALITIKDAEGNPRLALGLNEHNHVAVSEWNAEGEEVRFLRRLHRPFSELSEEELSDRLLPLAEADNKAEFLRVAEELLGCHSTKALEAGWVAAVETLKMAREAEA